MFTLPFLFFILSSFHSPYLSPHCLSISSFFLQTFSPSPISQAQPSTLFSITDLTSPTATDHSLHCRSHKPRPRPFSPSPISQAQPPTLFSIADLTRSAATDPSLHRRSHKPSRHRPFCFAGLVGRNQNGQGIGHGSWLSSGVHRYRGRDRCALAVVVPCFVVSG